MRDVETLRATSDVGNNGKYRISDVARNVSTNVFVIVNVVRN